VVRFNFVLSAAIGFVTALMLTTCASPSRVVWEYYDQGGYLAKRTHASALRYVYDWSEPRFSEPINVEGKRNAH
jgi:hypothetical protein